MLADSEFGVCKAGLGYSSSWFVPHVMFGGGGSLYAFGWMETLEDDHVLIVGEMRTGETSFSLDRKVQALCVASTWQWKHWPVFSLIQISLIVLVSDFDVISLFRGYIINQHCFDLSCREEDQRPMQEKAKETRDRGCRRPLVPILLLLLLLD